MRLFLDPTPVDVRERMREIFERDEFQSSKNPLQRMIEAFFRWLERNLNVEVGGSSWGGPIGTIIAWVGATILLIVLLVIIRMVIRNWRPRNKKAEAVATVDIEEERNAAEWASSAELYEAAGEWKEALRCRYRELVASLVDVGVVSSMAGRTTGELRSDVARNAPQVAPVFDAATTLFELPWYAHGATGQAENARFRSFAADVLAGAPRPAPAPAPDSSMLTGVGA